MFENWQGCTVEEEMKKRIEEKEEEEGERGRESGSKGQQRREINIPHLLGKGNRSLSHLPIDKREKD